MLSKNSDFSEEISQFIKIYSISLGFSQCSFNNHSKVIEPKSKLTFTDLVYISGILNFTRSYSKNLMSFNSAINLLFSIIYCIHLINKCVYVNGIFCSAIKEERYVQLFDIIFVGFFLSILKTLANITIIGISWIRLVHLLGDRSWVKKLIEIKNKNKYYWHY
ncbi:hypothetical protein BpHYR1_015712 [Brachionus plicatilis]|uniref:Uncharacterized protein n=1 Tax=Brachionus plicatilis TaxID=10195 RepID=A0A3M7PD39_BRAPC|nr:hypothetical protein BpHYR1_015712 [Brachionus plicatilis]